MTLKRKGVTSSFEVKIGVQAPVMPTAHAALLCRVLGPRPLVEILCQEGEPLQSKMTPVLPAGRGPDPTARRGCQERRGEGTGPCAPNPH